MPPTRQADGKTILEVSQPGFERACFGFAAPTSQRQRLSPPPPARRRTRICEQVRLEAEQTAMLILPPACADWGQ